jgi:carboxyl-terminal processing protease
MLDFKLKRKRVPLVSVDASYALTDEIGYIKVNRFSETTYDEFNEALDKLTDDGIESLILDLRNNPGGYIYAAEKIVDEFLEKDKLMLVTRNKNGEESKSFATRKGDFENGRVYVLINENSASASEIVAGALQDNDKGIIIGRRSFGKGLVQREMALGDGSAVRLTIARYYTPTGRSIQRPYSNGNGDYYRDYEKRYKNGELEAAENIEVDDSLRFVTPGGKVVYGGGGILPDVFVPKDTSVENETLEYISRSGFISYFIFEYLEKNRTFFDGMNLNQFAEEFEVPESLKEEFIAYSRFEEAQIDLRSYDADLATALKANIAQQLYGPNAFEYFLNDGDAMINKVLELESRNSAIKE